MSLEIVADAPEFPAQEATLPNSVTASQWEFNVQVTNVATRLGDLLVTAGSPYPGAPNVPVGVPLVRDAVFEVGWPNSGVSGAGSGQGRYRPPRNVSFQVSPAAIGDVVAFTKDNYTAPVATAGSEVGTLLTAGQGPFECSKAGETHLRILANSNQALYPVDAKTAFIFVASAAAVSMTVVFSD